MTWLAGTRIDGAPEAFLRSVGNVFAVFATGTQDSGNVSYGVEVDGVRYLVKTAGFQHDPKPFVAFDGRVAALRNAVRFAARFRHATLPELLRVIDSSPLHAGARRSGLPESPLLVYAWREGELLRVPAERRADATSSFGRFRALPAEVIERGLDAVFDLHAMIAGAGWIAVDFYDGALIYDFASERMSVIDLDLYRDGPFRNDMGRMFGSTRFMAPEELERGAWIDERTNVFTMGRTAAVLLADGTLDRRAFRGTDALFAVMSRACEPSPDARFQSMGEFHAAWRAARNA